MFETINEQLKNSFYHNSEIKHKIADYEKKLLNNEISSFEAARILLDFYYNK